MASSICLLRRLQALAGYLQGVLFPVKSIRMMHPADASGNPEHCNRDLVSSLGRF